MGNYAIISTYPHHKSQNVGDLLITESLKILIDYHKETSNTYQVYFRTDLLDKYVDDINKKDAVLIACFAMSINMFPDMYKIHKVLDKIKIPVIPISSSLAVKSEQLKSQSHERHELDEKTLEILKKYFNNNIKFSCRERITYNCLKSYGFDNAHLSGDVAMFDPQYVGIPFKQNFNKNGNILVTDPHGGKGSIDQFLKLLKMLVNKFPTNKITWVSHSIPSTLLKKKVSNLNIEIYEAYGDIKKLKIYDECEFHIGYRLHGHVTALRKRKPSFLIATDSRAIGYGRTFGGELVFNGFYMNMNNIKIKSILKSIIKLKPKVLHSKSIPNYFVIEDILKFAVEQSENNFWCFVGKDQTIDAFYYKMKEVINEIP